MGQNNTHNYKCFTVEGMVVIDKDYHVIQANELFLKSCNSKIDDVAGRHCYFVSHKRSSPCDEFGEFCPLKEVLKTNKSVFATHSHIGKDGNKEYIELSASPVRDKQGEITAIIEFSRKIKSK